MPTRERKKYGVTIILDNAPEKRFRIEDSAITWDGKGGIESVHTSDPQAPYYVAVEIIPPLKG